MPQLTEVEQVVYKAIGNMWSIYGHKHNDWSTIRVVCDAQGDLLNELQYHITSPECQMIKEAKDDINFLWWMANTIQWGDADNNPYNPKSKVYVEPN